MWWNAQYAAYLRLSFKHQCYSHYSLACNLISLPLMKAKPRNKVSGNDIVGWELRFTSWSDWKQRREYSLATDIRLFFALIVNAQLMHISWASMETATTTNCVTSSTNFFSLFLCLTSSLFRLGVSSVNFTQCAHSFIVPVTRDPFESFVVHATLHLPIILL